MHVSVIESYSAEPHTGCQYVQEWTHQVPGASQPIQERVNLPNLDLPKRSIALQAERQPGAKVVPPALPHRHLPLHPLCIASMSLQSALQQLRAVRSLLNDPTAIGSTALGAQLGEFKKCVRELESSPRRASREERRAAQR